MSTAGTNKYQIADELRDPGFTQYINPSGINPKKVHKNDEIKLGVVVEEGQPG